MLIRLARDRQSGGNDDDMPDVETNALRSLAMTLLDPATRTEDEATELLAAIEAVEPGQQVIRVPELEDDGSLQRVLGPQPPRAGGAPPDTVAKILGADQKGFQLVKSPVHHPIVVVDTCVYKALVGTQAQYPVHLRTTISFQSTPLQVGDFMALLDPGDGPRSTRSGSRCVGS